MTSKRLDGPIEMLSQAIGEAFPERTGKIGENFDGALDQAWQTFARMLGVTPLELARAVAPFYGVSPAGPLDKCTKEALALLTAGYCQQNTILPLRIEENVVVIATANPFDENVSERTRFLANRQICWVLAPPAEIGDATVFAYGQEAARLLESGDAISKAAQEEIDDNAIVKLGRALLKNAVEQRASDLHIQPYMGAFVARIRVDGVLRRLTMLPDAAAASLLRYLKTRSGMDASNSLIPQDGRMAMVVDDRSIDMRVSSLPASRGERLVVRFLDQSKVHSLSQARFSHASLQVMRRGIARPSGMVLMTGPTGSGKTSTLYGMLAELNRSSVNIITVENPVEYRIPGISQVEVNDKAGRSFMAALRSILRQDPDVVLIGEIRDRETAEIACQAALTGHLVLSTLHTNDALTAIPRLLNLGVQSTMLADSLAMVIAQRLCRTLCPHCKTPVTEPLAPDERTFVEVTHNFPGHRAVGCKACDYTGFLGRLPIVDIVEMSQGLRDAVALGESRLSELDKRREGGLRSLAASGSLRVISGETTVGELMEAIGPGFWPELAEHYGAVCFADTMEITTPKHVRAGQGVLVIAPQSGLVEALGPALEQEGLFLSVAKDAESAQTVLQRDEDIAFIIGDIPENATLPETVERLRRNRLHISWARLPAAILLPASFTGQEAQIRESGVMGALLIKPVDMTSIIDHIRHARAR